MNNRNTTAAAYNSFARREQRARALAGRLGFVISHAGAYGSFHVHQRGNAKGGFMSGDFRRVEDYLNRAHAAITVGRAVQGLLRQPVVVTAPPARDPSVCPETEQERRAVAADCMAML